MLILPALLATLAAASSPEAIHTTPARSVHRAGRPAEARARALVSRMTLEEKVAQLTQVSLGALEIKDGHVTRASLDKLFKGTSWGTLETPLGEPPETIALLLREAQAYLRSTRLGIPGLPIQEALHGALSRGATIFPQAHAQGATWNPSLIREMGAAIAAEASAMGVRQVLSPLFDLARDPRYGRVEECYGECPTLVSRMGVAFVQGLQGRKIQEGIPEGKVMAMAKHFAGYSVPNGGINIGPSSLGEREMRSLHLVPFEAAVKEAGIAAVMPSYNEVDGIPAHCNRWLLEQVLRREWNFQGYVFSDYGGVAMLKSPHGTVADAQEAAFVALRAGVDLEAPGFWGYRHLPELVKSRRVPEAWVDRAATRVLTAKFRAGLFDAKQDTSDLAAAVHTPGHVALARRMAQESIVLLKNDGVLPLDPTKVKSIAVVGPNADQVQFGDYSPVKDNAFGVTLLKGIREACGRGIQVRHAKGCDLVGADRSGFAEAVEAARQSNVVIVAVGETSMILEGVGWTAKGHDKLGLSGEGFDQSDLGLAGPQQALVEALVATGKPVIVVLIHGRALALPWIKEHAAAVVDAFYPGEQGGHGLSDVLFGKVDPGGRMPWSVPQSAGHIPTVYDHKGSGRGYYRQPGTPGKPGRDYVFTSPAPLWPFGYGLSYTRFAYSDLVIETPTVATAERLKVHFTVCNTGERAGVEVPQVYTRQLVSSTTTPVLRLRAFEKVWLQPGERRTLSFEIPVAELALWDETMTRVVEPGSYQLLAGSHAEQLPLQGAFQVRKPRSEWGDRLLTQDPDRIPTVPGPILTHRIDLPPRERARDLVARMALREKVGQLVHEAPGIQRLGVPAYVWWNECLHGVARAGMATVFPQATGLAASWDPEMLERVADAISTEGRAKHHDAVRRGERSMYTGLTFWSPNINLFRDPRWGRGQETYGEDPFLVGKLGAAFVRGIQGRDPKYLKAVATPKHFAVHSGPEADRHRFDAVPTERDFWESYLPHFETAIQEGGAWSVMGAYNRVYGAPSCANPQLLEDILRRRWGFKGYVVSDCWAVTDMYSQHKVFPSKVEAAAASLKAGCDVECGVDYKALLEAHARGLVTDADLDRALVRAFEARFRLGMFDPDDKVPFAKIPMSEVNCEAHRALALEAARKAMVLLKNDGTLPLDAKKLRRIAVVGPNADAVTPFVGNYNGIPRQAPTVLEALKARLGPGVEVVHVKVLDHTASTDPFAPVPDVLLEAEGKPGLRAEYFANPELKGEPVIVRQDAGIAFQNEFATHVSGWPLENASARWTGTFTAPSDGAYRLGLRVRQQARLWLDGQLAVDAWDVNETGKGPRMVPLALKAGQRVAVRLEYSHAGRSSLCEFLWDRKDLDLTARVLGSLRDVDAVVFIGGLNGDLEGEEGEPRFPKEGLDNGDRLTIELPRIQTEFLGSLRALGKPMILVNMSGGATALPEHPGALIQAWYPGEAGGTALAKVLLGDFEPGGRLPVTFYRSTADLPPFGDYRMEGRTYRFFKGEPQFPFGHGLGYTTFTLGGLRLPKGPLQAEGTATVRFTVRNTGTRPGEVLPQVYVARLGAAEPMPLQDLRAFQRVALKPGESRTVTLQVPLKTLRRWDTQLKDYRVDPGVYEVRAGLSSGNLPLKGRMRIDR